MSQQVLKDAYLAYSDELAIFAKPIQNAGITGIHNVDYLPSNDFTTQNVIEFFVPGNGGLYVDLKRTILNISCKIVKMDGSAITSPPVGSQAPQASEAAAGGSGASSRSQTGGQIYDAVGVVNNFMSSIISRVDISLQGRVMTPADHTYPYMAYLKNLLFTTSGEKQGLLQTELYYHDDAAHIRNSNVLTASNKGLIQRSKFFEDSVAVDMCGRLYTDLTTDLDRYIPNGVSIRVKLYLNAPEFCLMSTVQRPYKFAVTKIRLDYRSLKTL